MALKKEETKLNLWQKISLIMSEVNYIQKKLTVGDPNGKNSYQGTGAKDVFTKVNESMVAHGVVCIKKSFVFDRFYYEGEKTFYNKYSKQTETIKTFQREVIGTYVGHLVNIDNPEEREEISAIGQGIDSQDKASGKAQTYAMKQALLDTFVISTGTDTDNDHSDKITGDFAGNSKITKPQNPEKIKELPLLNESYKHFKAVCDGLKEGKTTVVLLLEKYKIEEPIKVILRKIEDNYNLSKTK